MIERAKNVWAAFRLVMGNKCNHSIELDEEGERMLAEHLELLWKEHIEISDDLAQVSRAGIAARRRLLKTLENPNIELDELVRLESEGRWRQRVCDGRKSVRIKFLILILLAVASLCIALFGPPQWNRVAVGASIGWLLVLVAELDGFREDAETTEVWRQYLTLSRAGDSQKAMDIMDEHVRKLIARTDELLTQLDMKLVDKIEALIQKEAHK